MRKTTAEVSKMKIADIQKQIQTTREEIAKLRLEKRVSPQKDSNLITKKRKRLAVMLTVLSEKQDAELVKKA